VQLTQRGHTPCFVSPPDPPDVAVFLTSVTLSSEECFDRCSCFGSSSQTPKSLTPAAPKPTFRPLRPTDQARRSTPFQRVLLGQDPRGSSGSGLRLVSEELLSRVRMEKAARKSEGFENLWPIYYVRKFFPRYKPDRASHFHERRVGFGMIHRTALENWGEGSGNVVHHFRTRSSSRGRRRPTGPSSPRQA